MPSSATLTVSKAVAAELNSRFGAHFTRDEIESYVNDAAQDLAGSVSVENLPEMAVRLTVIRMGTSLGHPVRH